MKEIDIAVLGAKGLVGSQTSQHLEDFGVGVIRADIEEVDITKPKELDTWMKTCPAPLVINFVAYTDVDGAEKERGKENDPVVKLNVEGARLVAQSAKKYKKFLIYISTDMVFPTDKEPGPYSEDVKPQIGDGTIGWYAKTKLMGERAVAGVGGRHALIRISYPFGNPDNEKDFVLKTRQYIESGIPLFTDQKFTPTYILDLANAILEIVSRQKTGLFHVATHPPTTPYEFGSYLAEKLNMDQKVQKGSLDDFMKQEGKAPRSKAGGLTTELTEKGLGIEFRSWQEAIDDFVDRIKS